MKPSILSNERVFQNEHQITPRTFRYEQAIHPSWRALIEYCADLGHGEIEILKIQDGLPVLAEVTRKKVKFVP